MGCNTGSSIWSLDGRLGLGYGLSDTQGCAVESRDMEGAPESPQSETIKLPSFATRQRDNLRNILDLRGKLQKPCDVELWSEKPTSL
jgi:hypothetical protein